MLIGGVVLLVITWGCLLLLLVNSVDLYDSCLNSLWFGGLVPCCVVVGYLVLVVLFYCFFTVVVYLCVLLFILCCFVCACGVCV